MTQPVTLELIDPTGGVTPIDAELDYDPRDPYAVTTVFMTGSSQVRWTFGRDLLTEGLYEPSGDGDVHVWPCLDSEGHAVVIIELCSPDGEALVQAKTNDLSTFVERMSAAVAPGNESEHLDMDAAIAAIFDAEAAEPHRPRAPARVGWRTNPRHRAHPFATSTPAHGLGVDVLRLPRRPDLAALLGDRPGAGSVAVVPARDRLHVPGRGGQEDLAGLGRAPSIGSSTSRPPYHSRSSARVTPARQPDAERRGPQLAVDDVEDVGAGALAEVARPGWRRPPRSRRAPRRRRARRRSRRTTWS